MEIKEVLLKDAKIGMCLYQDVISNKGDILLKAGNYITSREQILRFYDDGVKSLSVNATFSILETSKDDIPPDNQEYHKLFVKNPDKIISHLKEEVQRSKEFYTRSVDVLNEVMDNARFGKAINMNPVRKQSENIINSIKRDKLALLSLLDLKNFDEYTFTHSANVAILSVAFAYHLHFPEEKLLSVGRGAFLHDVGKSRVPFEILNKNGKLEDTEFKIMQKHPVYGDEIYEKEAFHDEIERAIVLHHHESFDGSGYPYGQAGNEINRFAAMASISDFYDALTTVRVYKKIIPPPEAIQIIYSQSGKKFDPRVVNHFIKTIGIFPIGSLVKLNNEQTALVIAFSDEDLLKPIVKIILDAEEKLLITPKMVSLMDSDLYITGVYQGDFKLKTNEVI